MVRQSQTIDDFMMTLDHPLKEGVERLRAAILASNPQITEHVKWKAPSFCYGGEDRVTFKLHPQDRLQLIFHRGAKVRTDSDDFFFEDDTGLLDWITPDRAVLTLRNLEEVQAKQATILTLINRWIQA